MREKKSEVLTMYIASKIEEQRDILGMTQDQFAAKTGISRTSQVNIEKGRQGLTIRRIYEVALALGIEPSKLLPDLQWFMEHKDKRLKKVITFVIDDE